MYLKSYISTCTPIYNNSYSRQTSLQYGLQLTNQTNTQERKKGTFTSGWLDSYSRFARNTTYNSFVIQSVIMCLLRYQCG